MPNPKKAQVPITLSGETYLLRFDMNAVAELEATLGKPVHKIFGNLADDVGVNLMRTLLFHGLHAKQPNLTVSDVGDLMQFEEMGSYGEAIGRAISLAVTGKEPVVNKEAEDEDPLPPKPAAEPMAVGPVAEIGAGTGTS